MSSKVRRPSLWLLYNAVLLLQFPVQTNPATTDGSSSKISRRKAKEAKRGKVYSRGDDDDDYVEAENTQSFQNNNQGKGKGKGGGLLLPEDLFQTTNPAHTSASTVPRPEGRPSFSSPATLPSLLYPVFSPSVQYPDFMTPSPSPTLLSPTPNRSKPPTSKKQPPSNTPIIQVIPTSPSLPPNITPTAPKTIVPHTPSSVPVSVPTTILPSVTSPSPAAATTSTQTPITDISSLPSVASGSCLTTDGTFGTFNTTTTTKLADFLYTVELDQNVTVRNFERTVLPELETAINNYLIPVLFVDDCQSTTLTTTTRKLLQTASPTLIGLTTLPVDRIVSDPNLICNNNDICYTVLGQLTLYFRGSDKATRQLQDVVYVDEHLKVRQTLESGMNMGQFDNNPPIRRVRYLGDVIHGTDSPAITSNVKESRSSRITTRSLAALILAGVAVVMMVFVFAYTMHQRKKSHQVADEGVDEIDVEECVLEVNGALRSVDKNTEGTVSNLAVLDEETKMEVDKDVPVDVIDPELVTSITIPHDDGTRNDDETNQAENENDELDVEERNSTDQSEATVENDIQSVDER